MERDARARVVDETPTPTRDLPKPLLPSHRAARRSFPPTLLAVRWCCVGNMEIRVSGKSSFRSFDCDIALMIRPVDSIKHLEIRS